MQRANKIQRILSILAPLLAICIFLIVWFSSYLLGNFTLQFESTDPMSIYGSIIQGISGLLAVVLAAGIFRIQSLESRLQSLEQSTIDYIYKIVGHSYPEWDSRLEENICNGSIKQTYLKSRLNQMPIAYRLTIGQTNGHSEEDFKKDSDIQQQGLLHILKRHTNLENAIMKIKWLMFGGSILLITPIAYSLLLMMTTQSLSGETNFLLMALMVALSLIAISFLIYVVSVAMETVKS